MLLEIHTLCLCLMANPNGKHNNEVEEMKLYKINKHKRCYYCFTRQLKSDCYSNNPDLVLSSEASLKLRVYRTRQEAEKKIDNRLWRRK